MDVGISHFQCSVQNISLLPGATRSAALHACPWLIYFAPSALTRFPLAFIFRAFGALLAAAVPARIQSNPGRTNQVAKHARVERIQAGRIKLRNTLASNASRPDESSCETRSRRKHRTENGAHVFPARQKRGHKITSQNIVCESFASKVQDHSWIGSVQGAIATWSVTSVRY